MKKLLLLALLMPVIAFSQENEEESQVLQKKRVEFTSQIGSIKKFYDYKLKPIRAKGADVRAFLRQSITETDTTYKLHLPLAYREVIIPETEIHEFKNALKELDARASNDKLGRAYFMQNAFLHSKTTSA